MTLQSLLGRLLAQDPALPHHSSCPAHPWLFGQATLPGRPWSRNTSTLCLTPLKKTLGLSDGKVAKSVQADVLTIEGRKHFFSLVGHPLALRYRLYILIGAVWRPCVYLCFELPKNASYFSPGRIERQCHVRGGILEAADLAGHRHCTILLPGWAVPSHIWWRKREESTKIWALSVNVFLRPPSWGSLGGAGREMVLTVA